MSPLEQPLQNLCEGKTLAEVVLMLWHERTNAGTIMSLCKISEAELEEIVPRSLWIGHKMIPCRHCKARGYFSREVSWDDPTNPAKAKGEPDATP